MSQFLFSCLNVTCQVIPLSYSSNNDHGKTEQPIQQRDLLGFGSECVLIRARIPQQGHTLSCWVSLRVCYKCLPCGRLSVQEWINLWSIYRFHDLDVDIQGTRHDHFTSTEPGDWNQMGTPLKFVICPKPQRHLITWVRAVDHFILTWIVFSMEHGRWLAISTVVRCK